MAVSSVANLVAPSAAWMVDLMVDLKAVMLVDWLVAGLERQKVETTERKTAEQMVDRKAQLLAGRLADQLAPLWVAKWVVATAVAKAMRWVGELAARMVATKAENWDIQMVLWLVEVLVELSVARWAERMETEMALTTADRWVSRTVAKLVDQWESPSVELTAVTTAATLGEEKALNLVVPLEESWAVHLAD